MGGKRPDQVHIEDDGRSTDHKTLTDDEHIHAEDKARLNAGAKQSSPMTPVVLHGERIAVLGGRDADVVAAVLRKCGAETERLDQRDMAANAAEWHSAPYAALVVAGAPDAQTSDRTVQLMRECLLADKLIAVHGAAARLLLASGSVAGRSVAVDEALAPLVEPAGARPADGDLHDDDGVITARSAMAVEEFAGRVGRLLAQRLAEQRVDEMSDLSFPASDPPAATPASVGRPVRPEEESRP